MPTITEIFDNLEYWSRQVRKAQRAVDRSARYPESAAYRAAWRWLKHAQAHRELWRGRRAEIVAELSAAAVVAAQWVY